MGLVVFLELLFSPVFGMPDVFAAFFQTNRRYAHFRKRKMIRAIERTLSRTWVGRNLSAPFACDIGNDVLERRSLCSQWHKVARGAEDVHRVKVDVSRGLVQRHSRMKRVPLRADQPLLLAGRNQEHK